MAAPSSPEAPKRMSSDLSRGMKRGARLRCPNCGQGKLFHGYLKVNDACPECAADLTQFRADDGPAYATILLVGHLIIAPLLLFPWVWEASPWLVLGITLPALALVSLVALPVIKGAWVGMLWAHAQERDRRVDPTRA